MINNFGPFGDVGGSFSCRGAVCWGCQLGSSDGNGQSNKKDLRQLYCHF